MLLALTQSIEDAATSPVGCMFYSNFDTNITERFGLLLMNWPLKDFSSPSDISSRVELNLLLNAWKLGATYFYKMSPAEYNVWKVQHSQLSTSTSSGLSSTATSDCGNGSGDWETSVGSADQPDMSATNSTITLATSNPMSATSTPLATNFVNVVSGINGELVKVAKKPRKVCKDKGKPRPKKQASNENVVDEAWQ